MCATYFAKSDDHSHDYESEGHRNAHMRYRSTRKLIDDNHNCTTKKQTKGSIGFGDITLFIMQQKQYSFTYYFYVFVND